jgi:hypothetical protein
LWVEEGDAASKRTLKSHHTSRAAVQLLMHTIDPKSWTGDLDIATRVRDLQAFNARCADDFVASAGEDEEHEKKKRQRRA